MSFKQIRKNAAKNRKSSGLFFGSLIIAIIAFYTLLSMENQDVIRFLKTLESDAVGKLMGMIPVIYAVSLFFVFFLVFFAYRYQYENRRNEFGIYLMMGMKRRSLFAVLMGETLWNSLISIVIGLPASLLLTEGISLATARIVGLGIIGHQFSLSLEAVLWTVAGFAAVQILAALILSAKYSRMEPGELMNSSEKQPAITGGRLSSIFGIILLGAAYASGIVLLKSFDFLMTLMVLVLGTAGTFLLYRGLGVFIGSRITKKSREKTGLYTFTARQIQESVLSQHKTLAVSSLLLLMAIACISFGIGTAAGRGNLDARSVDLSILEDKETVESIVNANKEMVSQVYPMYVSRMDMSNKFSLDEVAERISELPDSDLKENMVENFQMRDDTYLISETSYNNILKSAGKEPISLKPKQAAVYTTMKDSGDFISILDTALMSGAGAEVAGERYELLPKTYYDSVTSDRGVILYAGLIVRDEDFKRLAEDAEIPFCWNIMLDEGFVEENGLMQAILQFEQKLDGADYESYLSGIGRNLFYTVSSSYITIYLGILFMIIANTVIGLKYLIQQRENKRRYVTLLMLGGQVQKLCKSASRQIRVFFILVLSVAALSSAFAVTAMFTSFLSLPAGTSLASIIFIAGISFLLFIMIECIYIYIVTKAGRHEIYALSDKE